MIAFLQGNVVSVSENRLLLDVNHVGFQVYISARDAQNMPSKGQEVLIHTYMSVREDAMTLFGFLEEDDLEIYKMMLNVSGIGPKAGLGILSALSADEIRFAVLADDAKAIAKAPGIGNKTAQELILELKDKLDLQEAFEKKLEKTDQSKGAAREDLAGEAVQALVQLGYSNTEAFRAVRSVEGEAADVETLLKLALKKMI